MALTLTTYVNRLKRLLRDSAQQFFGAPDDPEELYDYVNEARRKVAADTQCLREYHTQSLEADKDTYDFPEIAFANAQGVSSVISLWVIDGTTRFPTNPKVLYDLNLGYNRRSTTRTGRPCEWTRYGANQLIVAPTPNRVYSSEWDLSMVPEDLTVTSPDEFLPIYYTDLVPFYGAHLAFFGDKALEETSMYEAYYYRRLQQLTSSIQAHVRGL